MRVIGFIPARLKSTRLSEKMLREINNRPLVSYTLNNAMKARMLSAVYVATDSPEIKAAVEKAGGAALMTPPSCASGTERVIAAMKLVKAGKDDIIINIQGDEPLLEPENIDRAVCALIKDKNFSVSTLAVKITDKKDIDDKGAVKVVVDKDGGALYFSRSAIPFDRDGSLTDPGYALKHIGLYVFRKPVLDNWKKMKSRYDNIEKLEQLKLLENGYRIKVVTVKSASIGIDTALDLRKLKNIITKNAKGV